VSPTNQGNFLRYLGLVIEIPKSRIGGRQCGNPKLSVDFNPEHIGPQSGELRAKGLILIE
jgi:hypothetical protein